MSLLNYTDDEVLRFHPIFYQAANEALRIEKLDTELEWLHHLRMPGNTLIPDFVLIRRNNQRWVCAVEIKRARSSVDSTRNQVQAKGYAEHNADRYEPGAPKYFGITNLEKLILFALNEGLPPNQCRLQEGVIDVGFFTKMSDKEFRSALVTALRIMIQKVLLPEATFDSVWPAILADFIKMADEVIGTSLIVEPNTMNWNIVRDFVCHKREVDTARILLLRCLLAEYLRGVLHRFSHPLAGRLMSFRKVPANKIGGEAAIVFSRVQSVDFGQLFEQSVLIEYRSITSRTILANMKRYVDSILTSPKHISFLATTRLDHYELVDGLLVESHLGEELDNRGKVVTDPELAGLLAGLLITGPDQIILDPCCGDGALLEGAYNRLRILGANHEKAVSNIYGIEADPFLTRLAILRLLLNEPATIGPTSKANVMQGDMFCNHSQLASADIILMNPPFKRYEQQDAHPVPIALKTHYADCIQEITGFKSIAEKGQQNLYTYYIEYVIAAAKKGCRLGIILDNKWYHSSYGKPVRELLLRKCDIDAIVEYPHSGLFEDWSITTSILICRKIT